MLRRILISACLLAPLALGLPTSAPAQSDGVDAATSAQDENVRRMLAIREALEARRARIRGLLEQLDGADEGEQARIREQIAAHRETVRDLTTAFESIAVGGATLRDDAAADERPLEWHQELTQIARPLLNRLREATEKPRRIAELRTRIELYQQQLDVARRALASVAVYDREQVPPAVAEGLDAVATNWRERAQDVERSLDVARAELASLQASEGRILTTLGRVTGEFLLGSGLTLLLATLVGVALWLALRSLQRLVRRWRRRTPSDEQAARIRLLLYSYQLLTMVLVTLAVLAVFYARGDVLLLSLAIIALIMLVLGIWRFLPRYVQEARLLLNVGPVREGERVNWNGLPFQVATLNLYSELRNPDLDGVVRLPLSALAQLTSRPRTAEAWFPSRAGDYVLLPDGNFGEVLAQTVEQVELRIMGSIVHYPAAAFLGLGVRNLSREGFGVVVVFGIDYAHQAIALDKVPERFRSGLERAFAEAGLGDDLQGLVVEFKEAGASSLDYLVYATLAGASAASYFRIGRLIQQTCVDICNREDWVIPFTQVTVHQADGDPEKLAGDRA